MIRTTTFVALIAVALLTSESVGLGAERRASQRVITVVHPLRSLDVDTALKTLPSILSGTDQNVVITPDVERNRIVIQAPANEARRLQRFLSDLERIVEVLRK